MSVHDRHGRPLGSLRMSVTDRCNLRCAYCMPEPDYVWLPRSELLSFEELARLARLFVGLGVTKLRLTGGEPLLRAELPRLVEQLVAIEGLEDVALTTNGILLAEQAAELRRAGLHRVTVSLDTLDAARFRALTRRDELPRVLAGLDAAVAAGFAPLKVDTVVLRGTNDDELVALIEHARARRAEVRFIEYMDVGGATQWSPERVVTQAEILARLEAAYGPLTRLPAVDAAPAARWALPDGHTFGVIASVTEAFCGTCDRGRLTADGTWLACLYAQRGHDLRKSLREGASDEALTAELRALWEGRTDRGAYERAQLPERAPLVQLGALRRDPRLEMHTRGG